MIRLALATALALPAAAQAATGSCQDEAQWEGAAGTASFGPCDTQQPRILTFTCADGTAAMIYRSPYPIAVGQRGTADLTIDGRDWRLDGSGVDLDGIRMLSMSSLPDDVLPALRGGATARISGPSEAHPVHLSGSGAALASLCS